MIKKAVQKLSNLIQKPDHSPLRKGKKTNFIFIHINKTGGTSIANAIGLPNKRHLPVREVIEMVGQKEFEDAFVFAVIRNPWDKVVSHYKYRIKTGQTGMTQEGISFKDWVRRTYGQEKDPVYYDIPQMFAPQVDWLRDQNDQITDVHIMKFESLNADFQEVARIIGLRTELPHLNATKKDHYSTYYDGETIEIIRQWFHEDIQRFNYSFEA